MLTISGKNADRHGVNTPYEIVPNSASTRPVGMTSNGIHRNGETWPAPSHHRRNIPFQPSLWAEAGRIGRSGCLPGCRTAPGGSRFAIG